MKSKSLFTIFTAAAGILLTAYTPFSYAADLGIKIGDNNNQATLHEIVRPGQTINRYAEVINSSINDADASILAKDGYQGEDGAYTFIATDETNVAAGNWYTVSNQDLSIKAGSVQRVDFTLKVPEGTAPGEYGSSLAVVEKASDQVDGNIRIVNRNGLRNLIIVPGSKPSELKLGNKLQNLSFITSPETKKITSAQYELQNIGNLFAKSEISAELTGPNNFSQLQRVITDIAPGDKTIKIDTKFDVNGWQNGGYRLAIDMKNTPVNRKITRSDYVYEIKNQRIVFDFDVNAGQVSNLTVTENTILKDDANEWWKNPTVVTVTIALFALLSAGVIVTALVRNKDFLARFKNKKNSIQKQNNDSNPTKVNL